jgi:hypothetical protein
MKHYHYERLGSVIGLSNFCHFPKMRLNLKEPKAQLVLIARLTEPVGFKRSRSRARHRPVMKKGKHIYYDYKTITVPKLLTLGFDLLFKVV